MGEHVTRVTVTLPAKEAEEVKRLVAEGQYPSVSAFMAELVAERLAETEAQKYFWSALREQVGELTEEERAWIETARAASEQAQDYYASLDGEDTA
ncbi:ribbon-helix-helix domain-containing protein [Planotetraspora sp. A-T 1434]|uniref:ribbon-helix-helix domain-containing protein n=1 Tax=Planotetraspora sp. A-T 1434 TaxID=2979219 RepID=UPI0021C01DA8|nr:ribbon-helix-helix domain-containing protein [Planotetraspora sp. A-T 1434]MCT9932319.1 ribbon-helix-helix domain-containing protein [Planotetraspora sp. A-T 1434]